MKVRVIASLVMALCLAFTGSAFASSIGVFFAADGSDCDGSVPQFVPTNLYVLGVLGGDAAAGGLTGAEFRLDGLNVPSNIVTPTPNPLSSVAIGNPATGGCNIAFAACQTGPNVLLYTIQVLALSVQPPATLRIDRHTTPSNPNFPCSLLVLCDAPVFTKLCVPGGEGFLNDPSRNCTVGVEQTSWSSVKGLFN